MAILPHDRSRVLAVLGPTNTGKTHFAVERMLAHRSGLIGFPLRLLAREIYERILAHKGPAAVALITGEEKIQPEGARYFVATVEAMPEDLDVSFLAVDEIQLCADLERGHVFTDRLLRARGRDETMFLGADTIRPLLRALVPEAEVITRPRFSTLSSRCAPAPSGAKPSSSSTTKSSGVTRMRPRAGGHPQASGSAVTSAGGTCAVRALQHHHSMTGQTFAATKCAESLGGRRLEVDASDIDPEIRRNVAAHRGPVPAEPRSLCDQREVGVHHSKAARSEQRGAVSQEHAAACALPFRVAVREMLADVALAQRTEQRVAQRVQQHVAVGVRHDALRVWNRNAAESDRIARTEGVYVVAVPDAHR